MWQLVFIARSAETRQSTADVIPCSGQIASPKRWTRNDCRFICHYEECSDAAIATHLFSCLGQTAYPSGMVPSRPENGLTMTVSCYVIARSAATKQSHPRNFISY